MKQRLPFLRNRSLYRRRTIKFDRFDPSLVETPFLDLSFRAERSPFQRRRSEKRPTSVFQKRIRAESSRRKRRSWARLMRPEKRNAYSFILSTFKRVALKRRVRFIILFSAHSSRNRRSALSLFSLFFQRRQALFSFNPENRSNPENGDETRSAGKRASTTKSP